MMSQIRRLSAVFASAVVALIAGVQVASADAGPFPNPGYEIEAKLNFCAEGGTGCLTPTGPVFSEVRFAIVDLYSFTPADADAKPQAGQFKCAGRHFLMPDGIHAITMFATPGPTQFGFDGGWIRGKASVRDATEASHDAVGRINLKAYDPISKDTAEVEGTQVTDNPTDSHVRGGFEIELTGVVYDENVSAGPGVAPTPIGMGHMSCSTNHTALVFPPGPSNPPPPNFESVLVDNDSPAS